MAPRTSRPDRSDDGKAEADGCPLRQAHRSSIAHDQPADDRQSERQEQAEVADDPRLGLEERGRGVVAGMDRAGAAVRDADRGWGDIADAEGEEARRRVAVGGRERPPFDGVDPVTERRKRCDE